MTDRKTIFAVVLLIGFFAIILVAGAFVLIAMDKTVPDPIWTLGGGALGGLTAMLVSTRSVAEDQPPVNVNVVNPPKDPVNVDPVP